MRLINTEATREFYAPFETIEQLNANTQAIRERYAEFMTKSEKAVLDVLHRFSTKHYGVCYLCKNSIAEKVGLTRRQVIRICSKFELLGFIRQYKTERKAGGGQTANTIVFLTQLNAKHAFVQVDELEADNMKNNDDVVGDVTPDGTGLDALKDTPKDLLNTKDTDARVANKNGLVSKLPKTLQFALAPFFDAEELYAMAGVVYKAKASVDKEIRLEDHHETYYEVITKVMNAYGRGKAKNVAGLLYSAVQSVTRGIWVREQSSLFGI